MRLINALVIKQERVCVCFFSILLHFCLFTFTCFFLIASSSQQQQQKIHFSHSQKESSMSYNPFGYSYSQSTKTMSSTSSSTVFSAEIMQPQLIDQSWRFTNSNGFTRFHPSQHQERFPFYPMAPTAYSMGSACSVSSSPPISPHNPNKQFFFGEQNMPHYSMSERVWSPLDVSTLPQTLIENKSQVNRESTYTCTQYSMSPISPRPIKKTIKKTDPGKVYFNYLCKK